MSDESVSTSVAEILPPGGGRVEGYHRSMPGPMASAGALVPAERGAAEVSPSSAAPVAMGRQEPVQGHPAGGYDLRGLHVDEDDRAGWQMLGEAMRPTGMTQRQFSALASWYNQYTVAYRQAAEQAVVEHNDHARGQTEAILQQEWGPSYGGTISAVEELYRSMPMALRTVLRYGDTHRGVRALNDPDVLRWLAGIARGPQSGPVNRVPPEQEMAEIEEMIGDRFSPYYKGPRAQRLQARYRELLRAQEGGAPSPVKTSSRATDRIAQLEAMMRNDRARWFKSPDLQAEYRRLIGG